MLCALFLMSVVAGALSVDVLRLRRIRHSYNELKQAFLALESRREYWQNSAVDYSDQLQKATSARFDALRELDSMRAYVRRLEAAKGKTAVFRKRKGRRVR